MYKQKEHFIRSLCVLGSLWVNLFLFYTQLEPFSFYSYISPAFTPRFINEYVINKYMF